ncbi:MAG TPA: SET domain-containing protein [Hyphomonadaceae bacterium]|nr:SET domain-containing protein [Hyphomonadaceae bacterium]
MPQTASSKSASSKTASRKKASRRKAKPSYKPGDFEFAVRRSRTGLGLYTMGEIPKGAVVIEYIGKTLTAAEYAATNSKYLFELGPKKTIDGAPRWNTARYINHSCRPNCEIDVHNRRAFIRAKRAIKPGEELSYNYGEDYFDEYINGGCRCLKCQPKAGPPGVKSTIQVKAKKRT